MVDSSRSQIQRTLNAFERLLQTPLSILVVEDDVCDAFLLESLLLETPNRFSLTFVSTLAEARTAVDQTTFDFALLDLCLPDSRGIETFERLRAQAPSLAIIVLSGMGETELGHTAMRAGAADYLLKGKISAYSVQRAIAYTLERDRLRNELAERRATAARSETERSILAQVSRELRTPIDSILQTIELVHDQLLGPITEEQRAKLEIALANADHLKRVVERLAEIRNCESGAPNLRSCEIDLPDCPRDAVVGNPLVFRS